MFVNCGTKLKEKFVEIFALRYSIFFVTFIILILKNILFIGFMVDRMNLKPNVLQAIKLIFFIYTFRPIYFCGFLLIFVAPIFFTKKNYRINFAIIVNLFISILFLTYIWYLRGFNSIPTLYVFQSVSNVSEYSQSVFAVFKLIDILFVIDIPLIILFSVYGFKLKLFKNINSQPVIALVLIVFSIISLVFIAPKTLKKVPIYWIFNNLDSKATTYNISPLGFMVSSSYHYFKDNKKLKLSDEYKNNINLWYRQKDEHLKDNKYKGLLKGKNLIVIQVESLENFVINHEINKQPITPNLNSLLGNALYFSNIYEQVNQGNSSDADLLINTSTYPVRNGVTFYTSMNNTYNSMPHILGKYGYFTSAFHPDSGSFWNWMPALKSMGFKKCYDTKSYKVKESTSIGITDGCYLPQVEKYIREQNKPFYSFVVTLTSHTPFVEIPKNYKKLNLNVELGNSKLGGYLQLIHYTDEKLGEFFKMLDKDKLIDNTVIAIYGDHEGIHKYFPDDIYKVKQSESWWLNNGKRIPLIIYNRSLKKSEQLTVGGQVDVFPTIAYLLDIDENLYKNTAFGRNLLKTKKNFAILKDGTVMGNIAGKEKQTAIEGLGIADKIIRGNYFEGRLK